MKPPKAIWLAIDVLAVAILGATVLIAAKDPQLLPASFPSESPATTIEIDGLPANYKGTFDLATAKDPETEVKAGAFFFLPTIIQAPKGSSFLVELENESKLKHTFTIKALGIDQVVDPYERKVFLIKHPPPGTYLIICRFHANLGMRGALKIVG